MTKKEITNTLELTDKQLQLLYIGRSIDDLVFCEKSIERHANGFYIDLVIFKKGDKYYKFLAIEYLGEELTFTIPFQVFKTEEKITRTKYSHWVDVKED